MNILALLLGIIVMTILGCGGGGVPDEGIISKQLTKKLEQLGVKNYYDIVNLKKTNGFEKDKNTYVVDIEFDLVMPQPEPKDRTMEIVNTANNFFGVFINIKDGMHFVGKATFLKTEQGWTFDSMETINAEGIKK
jgi:hypothetical protein